MTRLEAIARILDHMERHNIGEYPHVKLDEAIMLAISALRGPTREQVEKLRGEWLHDTDTGYEVCDRCSHTISLDDYLNRNPPPFCENCGSPMTDKAVDILLRRLEAMYDG